MSDNSTSIYDLFRNFWDWSFENPDLIKPEHCAIYAFAVEHCNRLGWKDKFGFPAQMAMEAIGIKSWRTYSKCFNDLVEWGFVILLQKSKNQYSANVIAIAKKTKASAKALDKALQKHSQKQCKYNNTNIQLYNYTNIPADEPPVNTLKFDFKQSLLDNGADEQLADDWLKVRKELKATNTETALNTFVNEVKKSGHTINEVLKICCVKSWKGFKNSWSVDWDTNEHPKVDEAGNEIIDPKAQYMCNEVSNGCYWLKHGSVILNSNGKYKMHHKASPQEIKEYTI